MTGVWCCCHERDRKCHDSARFAAHFRRTRRLGFHHRLSEREWGSRMKKVTADLAKKTNQKNGKDRRAAGGNTALAGCYGQIGISAVVAAARYQGGSKLPAEAPVSSKWRDLFAEAAA
jgi:hypothetical protein